MNATKSDFARSKSILEKQAPEYLWYVVAIGMFVGAILILFI